MNNTVHIIAQGKGGCGKSLAATILCQYIRDYLNDPLDAYDTDQVNTTLAHYKALNVKHIKIVDDDLEFNSRKFDALIQDIAETTANVVIDTGANTFLTLLGYIFENDVINLLETLGKRVFIHTILGGGDLYDDTYNGLSSIVKQLDGKTIIWVNEFFGSDVFESVQKDTLIKKNLTKICGFIQMPELKKNTIGEDIRIMNAERITLVELGVSTKAEHSILMKNRVKTLFKHYYESLDSIKWSDDNGSK